MYRVRLALVAPPKKKGVSQERHGRADQRKLYPADSPGLANVGVIVVYRVDRCCEIVENRRRATLSQS